MITNRQKSCLDSPTRTLSDFGSCHTASCLSSQLACRYEYYGGIRGGISHLLGRDQAVANALVQMYYRTNIELFLAFVNKEESGRYYTVSM